MKPKLAVRHATIDCPFVKPVYVVATADADVTCPECLRSIEHSQRVDRVVSAAFALFGMALAFGILAAVVWGDK